MDGLVDGGRVTVVHVLALAVGGALSLEGPDETDGFVLVLGDSSILSFHHVLDGAVARFSEAGHRVSVSVGVEDRNGLVSFPAAEELGEREPDGPPGAGLSTMVYQDMGRGLRL